ncbi:branched-chain alpha-ketoacid dehydrogenase kinase [Dipodascopsis uninucleata]
MIHGIVSKRFISRLSHSRKRPFTTFPRLNSRYSLEEPGFAEGLTDIIDKFAEKDVRHELIQFGKPPIANELLLRNASEIKTIILGSLARRTVALKNLPYIMLLNPNISQIYFKYLSSFNAVYQIGEKLESIEDNLKFVTALQKIIQEHTDAIPTLAKGFSESHAYIDPLEADKFLDTHLRARIGTRLLANHHVEITAQSLDIRSQNEHNYQKIGVVDTAISPAEMVYTITDFLAGICDLQYGMRPVIEIDHGQDVTITYIPDHLEYILTELLKNSFRATIEKCLQESSSTIYLAENSHNLVMRAIAPVFVTILQTPSGIQIRLRDEGGGIEDSNLKRIWGYAESTFEEEERSEGFKTLNTPPPSVTGTGGSSMGGLGYGLPLSRAYAEYFGGSINLESCYGWGVS